MYDDKEEYKIKETFYFGLVLDMKIFRIYIYIYIFHAEKKARMVGTWRLSKDNQWDEVFKEGDRERG